MGKLDMDKIKKARERIQAGQASGSFWKPSKGKNKIRFLRKSDEKIAPFFLLAEHTINKRYEVCRKSVFGESCPICDFVSQLFEEGSDESVELAKKMIAKDKSAWVIIDIDAGDNMPKIFKASPGVSNRLLNWLGEDEYGDFTDFETGRNFTLERGKDPQSGFVSYGLSPLDKEPLTDDAKKTIMANYPSFDLITDNVKSKEEMEIILANLTGGSTTEKKSADKEEKSEKKEEKAEPMDVPDKVEEKTEPVPEKKEEKEEEPKTEDSGILDDVTAILNRGKESRKAR